MDGVKVCSPHQMDQIKYSSKNLTLTLKSFMIIETVVANFFYETDLPQGSEWQSVYENNK